MTSSRLFERLLSALSKVVPRWLVRAFLLWPYRSAYRRAVTPGQLARLLPRNLSRIVTRHADTEFGQNHRFDEIGDLQQFAERVPLFDYRGLDPLIRRELGGEPGVLLARPAEAFASDDHADPPRLIPVTPSTRLQWRRVEQLVERAIVAVRPRAARGRWLRLLPVYTPPGERHSRVVVAPLEVLEVQSADERWHSLPHQLFTVTDEQLRYYLILRSSMCQDVRVLRAATPGTLSVLAEHLALDGRRLVEHLASGEIAQRKALPQRLRIAIEPQPARPDRAEELERTLHQRGRLGLRDIWPNLEAVVCATGGPADKELASLREQLGDVAVIDPGYRCAEGIITLPAPAGEGGNLLLADQIVEFLPVSSGRGVVLGADALVPGERYVPVLTADNGIYRCKLEHVLEVTSVVSGVPRMIAVDRRTKQLPLDGGGLEQAQLLAALERASADIDVALVGQLAWIQPSDQPLAESSDDDPLPAESEEVRESARSWWRRLFRLAKSEPAAEPVAPAPLPALACAVEPTEPLEPSRARALLELAEAALCEICPAYGKQRAARALGSMRLIVLEQGAFARWQRQRAAAGAPNAHLAGGVLCHSPGALATSEAAFTIA